MVFLAPSKLVRLSASKKWDCAISGQRLGNYSPRITLHDTECSEKFMGERTLAVPEAPAVKRKRGRPRKADTLAAQAAAGCIGAPSPVKRKRGRPRKADTIAAQAAASDGIGHPPVKRKRGRPRKADILASQVAAGGFAAVGSVASVPNDNAVGLVSENDYDESPFSASSDSDSDLSSDSDYVDDDEDIPNLTQSFQTNSSSDSDCDDDDGQAAPNQTQSSAPNSSSDDSDFDEDDDSSDEDFNHLDGRGRQGMRRKRRRSGDKVDYRELATGEICHWCRQRSERIHVHCSLCVIKFCPPCLMNRQGEKIQDETRIGVRWVCPRCRDGCGPGCKNCCNCGPCRRSHGKPPTGSLAHTARRAGFSNVHDYLINLKTGESAEVIARRKEGRGWTYATGAVGVSSIPPWGMKRQRTPKIPLGFLISKCREGREDAMACEIAEVAPVALPWFASEEQDSCTIQGKTGELCRKFAEFSTEKTQGGEDMSTSPDAVDYQFSSSDSNVSGSPLRTSVEAEGTECWRTLGAIPKRQRSARNRTARKEERDLTEVEHEKRPDVDMSFKGEGEREDHAGLPDLNTSCEATFELPDLNSPVIFNDGVTDSYSSGQEITGVKMCSEYGRHDPLSAESPESSFSVRTQVTSANEAEAATSTQEPSAAATLVRGDEFRVKLDLILQRPFSSEQLKEMWDHFMFHRPSQQEEYTHHWSSHEEADDLLCDYFSDLYEKLARTFSAVEKLKLLRAFFFWLQHSSMKGAFQPWATEGEEDQFEGCTPISVSDSQVSLCTCLQLRLLTVFWPLAGTSEVQDRFARWGIGIVAAILYVDARVVELYP